MSRSAKVTEVPDSCAAPAARTSALAIAEALQAIEYLQRAEAWAADVDQEIVQDIVRVERRLLDQVAALRGRRAAQEGRASGPVA